MNEEHTNNMPWDKIWDYRHYKVSKVRLIKRRVRLIEKECSLNK